MFKDRKEAGQLLADKLLQYKREKDTLVLAIPRGGVPVAYELAQRLDLPLDVVVIKKIGVPGNEELAAGATGLDTYILNEDVVRIYGISPQYIQEQVKIKQREVKQRYQLLRGEKPLYTVKNKTTIIVDDGLATGATMAMAIELIKKPLPKEVVIAIPVAPPDAVRRLEKMVDKVVCLLRPEYFGAISQFYEDFTQVQDEEARRLLRCVNA
jgi:putative phosphoribosyl transferase